VVSNKWDVIVCHNDSVVVVQGSHTLFLYSVSGREALCEINAVNQTSFYDFALSHDGSFVVNVYGDIADYIDYDVVEVWSTISCESLFHQPILPPVTAIAISHDDSFLVIAGPGQILEEYQVMLHRRTRTNVLVLKAIR